MRAVRFVFLCVALGGQMALGQGPAAAIGAAAECVGDCNQDGKVTVDELVTMVDIALGDTSFAACVLGAGKANQQVRIEEIVAAVDAAVNGCTGVPRVTPTPTSTPVPPPVCGNGRIEPPETCDQGNLVDGDGCDSHCQVETDCHCSLEPSVCVCFPTGCVVPNPLCSVPPATATPTATPTVPAGSASHAEHATTLG